MGDVMSSTSSGFVSGSSNSRGQRSHPLVTTTALPSSAKLILELEEEKERLTELVGVMEDREEQLLEQVEEMESVKEKAEARTKETEDILNRRDKQDFWKKTQ